MNMRRATFLLIPCALILSLVSVAQSYLGTKTPYEPLQRAYTLPPAGYAPVYVNYVGRHGARYLTKAGADVAVLEALQAAEKRNGLTEAGKRVMAAVEQIVAASKGNYENITLLGAEEQAAIGERMLYNDGPAFRGRGLTVVTTWKKRTQQSAEAFLRAFGKITGPRHDEQAADSLDVALRFYDLSPAYLRYKKSALLKKSLDSLDKDVRTARIAADVCGKVFTREYGGGALEFVDNLYDCYCIAYSMGGELRQAGYTGATAVLGAVFSEADLQWLDERSGAADFLEKGPGFDPLGLQVKVAAPLLVDFIRSSDKMAGDAVLRFTHAEAIAPFAALLGIKGASSPAVSIFHYEEQWRAGAVIPLSANIQWVFYSNGRDRLVKVLLNEKEVELPLKTGQWPYYRWEDVRRFYVGRLKKLGVGLGDDMRGYLKGLK